MDVFMISVLIIGIIIVAGIFVNASARVSMWEGKYHSLEYRYDQLRETNSQNLSEIDRLNKLVNSLRWKISSLEEQLDREKKYNRKANDSYIAKTTEKTTHLKEEIKNLKKSKPISRSKAVQYITQHSKFAPTQMNNQSTDSLLDYYWYLYLMNSFTDNSETQKKDESYEHTNSSTTKETESDKESTKDDSSTFPDNSWSSSSGYNGYTYNNHSSSSSSDSSDSSSSSSWGYSSNDSSYSSGSSSSYSDYSSSSSDSGSDYGSYD